jgi:hypothetical protein
MQIITPLLSHQFEAVAAFKKSAGQFAFLHTVGTGKSLTAMACLELCNAKRVLITSDKNNIINTWPDQLMEHTDIQELYIHVRPKSDVLKYASEYVICVNYDFIKGSSHLKDIPFDAWIGDESSEFKDQRTDRFKYLQNLVRHIPIKIILNAEPMTERLEDLFGQFKILDGGKALGYSLTEFRLRYMQPSATGYGWVPQRSTYTRIQKAVNHMSHWIVKRPDLKLPRKVFTTVRVQMTGQQLQIDKQLKQWFKAELDDSKIETNYAPVVFTKRIQLMGGVFNANTEDKPVDIKIVWTEKIPMLKEIIRRNPRSKIVVWHHYINETTILRGSLAGDFPLFTFFNPDNDAPLIQFKDFKGGCVMLIRDSMCKGLNQLADGDICVFYSHPLSYRQRMQAIGRTCRISSKHNELQVIDLVTEGGADEIVHHMLTQKRDFSLALSSIRSYV